MSRILNHMAIQLVLWIPFAGSVFGAYPRYIEAYWSNDVYLELRSPVNPRGRFRPSEASTTCEGSLVLGDREIPVRGTYLGKNEIRLIASPLNHYSGQIDRGASGKCHLTLNGPGLNSIRLSAVQCDGIHQM